MVHYHDFRFKKVNYEVETDPPHIKISYDEKKEPLVIKSPEMTFPFGIDTAYDRYIGKFRFENHKYNSDVDDFMKVLVGLENQMQQYLTDNIDGDAVLVSEFKFSDKYDPTVNVKLPTVRDKIITKFLSKNNSALSFMDIEKGTKAICTMLLDSIWKVKNKYYYKWKALEIKVLN